jgi:hypothetical protein
MLEHSAFGQATQPSIFGIYVDAGGALQYREQDARQELNRVRARSRQAAGAGKDQQLHFVSLPKLLSEARGLMDAGKTVPESLRYLGGMTQLRYILVYPEQKDVVIAGPAEEWEPQALEPRGKLSGRPVLQLDDLIVALRMAGQRGGMQAFGCSIDPPADALARSNEVMRQYGSRSRRELADAMARALGPQQVRFFGTPADTRVAMVCVAADYKLKRFSIGLEAVPVPGVGTSIDNSRAAGNAFWFETLYEPMLVAVDGNAFELRGQRLQLKAGALPFDEQGATEKAKAFAKRLTDKMNVLAAEVPLYADLQNITDLAMLAALIKHDKLDTRIQWDLSWVNDTSRWRVATVPAPRTVPTLVHYTGGSLAAGGVGLNVNTWLSAQSRQVDRENVLGAVRQKHER